MHADFLHSPDFGAEHSHEQVVYFQDPAAGLRVIVGIHSTRLGPALGGCRMYPYANTEQALRDVLRLSRGMTYKAAAAGLNLGGGKAVVLADPLTAKSTQLWSAYGRFLERLGGYYITAEDVGTTLADMAQLRSYTRFVVGTPKDLSGSGDPSPMTALGTFRGMQAAAAQRFGSGLAGATVAVQGCGNVGSHLLAHLHEAGAQLLLADVNSARAQTLAKRYGAKLLAPEDITHAPCDIFAPCALGGILNEASIPLLNCDIIAGAANNQLADEAHDGQRLLERGILYVPDFVLNAGGLINVAYELEGYNEAHAAQAVEGIAGRVTSILAAAKTQQIPPQQAAYAFANGRLQGAAQPWAHAASSAGELPLRHAAVSAASATAAAS